MLTRRARAYSSSCSQVINLGLSPSISSQFTLVQPKITKNPYFKGSRSIKVINVDNPKKLFASASYVKQHVYLQPFSC